VMDGGADACIEAERRRLSSSSCQSVEDLNKYQY
jgi:hypothetical protein